MDRKKGSLFVQKEIFSAMSSWMVRFCLVQVVSFSLCRYVTCPHLDISCVIYHCPVCGP